MVSERQPVSELAEIQQKDALLGALIDKRQAMLRSASSWDIARDDPDVENAARNHVTRLVEEAIPGSIDILERRRAQLREERTAYIQENAPDLIAKAQAYETNVLRERKVVDRLSRDLQRGFTTQEVVDRRIAQLQELEAKGLTDPDLQAGFELIAQRTQEQAVAELGIEAHAVAPKPTEEVLFLGFIPPLSPRLKPIAFVMRQEGNDPSDTVYTKVKRANFTEASERTSGQIQLLEDVQFLGQYTDSTTYQRTLTPEELHTLVAEVQKFLQGAPQFSLGLQREILWIVEKHAKERREKVDGLTEALKKINDSENPQGLSLDQLKTFAMLASKAIRSSRNVGTSGYIFHLNDQEVDWKQNVNEVCQAAFDIVGREVYYERITPKQRNIEIFVVNRDAVNAWYAEVIPLLDRLTGEESTAHILAEISGLIRTMNGRSVSKRNSEREVNGAISLQLKIGHSVDNLNNALQRFVRRRSEQNQTVNPALEEAVSPDAIPSLLTQLDHIASVHEHKYNIGNTVAAKAREAEAIEPELRTPEQQQLFSDIEILGRYSRSEAYREVYSPEELHDLVTKLLLLSQKNRPDFNGLEDQMLGIIEDQGKKDHLGKSEQLDRAIKRADRNDPSRRGVQWDTLINFAGRASSIIVGNLQSSADRMRYIILVHDPESKKYPDLTAAYQFVANIHILDVLGNRSLRVDAARRETFVANCQIINDWFTEVVPFLDRLPNHQRVTQLCTQIRKLIDIMNIRLQGRERTGFTKDYRLNPAGAISLQMKIGHTVETLKAQLAALQQPQIGEDKIIPLD